MAVEVFKLFGSIFVNNEEANKSISKTDEKASGVASTLGKGVKTAAKWSAAIVGGATAAAGGMVKMAESSAATADRVDKMSQKIGVSRQAYQELDFICSQTGTSVDKLGTGMKTLRGAMANDKNAEIFNSLGIAVTDADGKMRDSEAVMWDTINALQNVSNETEKAVLAQKLFGKSGQELMPLLNGQSGSIDEMKKKAHDLGLVMSDELIDSGVGLSDSLDQTKRAFSAIITQLGGAFMPIIKQVSDRLQSAMPYIQDAISQLAPIVSDFLSMLLPSLFDLGETLFPIIFDTFEQLLPVLQEFASTILPIILELLNQLAPILSQALQEILPILLQLLQELSPFFVQLAQEVLPLVVSLIQTLLPFAVQIVSEILPIFLQIMQMILPIAIQIISEILPIVIDLISKILPPILQIVEAILPAAVQILNAVLPLLQLLTDTILPLILQLVNLLTPAIEFLAELFGDRLSASISGVTQALKPFFDILNNVISFITNVFQGDWEDAWNSIVEVFKGIINLIPTAVESMINAAISVINGLIDGINFIGGWLGVNIDHIPDVELPRLRQGIDFVPSDNYPVALDYGEAVLTASEAEEYRKSKRESGTQSPFTSAPENSVETIKEVNQTFNINVTVEKISDNYDVDDFVARLSEQLAAEVQRAENVYA